SECSVEPGTAEDVGKILQILGATRTPFAVKSGGHTANEGFSSTTGVQIAMSRFNNVVYDNESQTVTYGTGLIWDEVYAALEPYGVNVVGARITGVGVGGVSNGGGYSWLTNQHGLTVDNIVSFEIVLPNGRVVNVTEKSDPDLFFSTKGVVTQIEAKAYTQSQVWGGVSIIVGAQPDALNAATLKFQANVMDPKAQVLPTYTVAGGMPVMTILMFYDAPNQPPGIFDDFLAIPAIEQDISTRSFLSLVQSLPNATLGARAVYNTVSLTHFTPGLLEAINNETQAQFWSQKLGPESASLISYDVELFLETIFTHGTVQSSAYPPSRKHGLLPLNIYYAWESSSADPIVRAAAMQSAAHLKAVAMAEGQDIGAASLYGNYAIKGTPVEQIFGESLPRMRATKRRVDPQDVMGLAGGWKVCGTCSPILIDMSTNPA
ncbi:uncharacterized protein PHACADRAFT_91510, partial [Phanerochaete carnosa HHB-10118-sp]